MQSGASRGKPESHELPAGKKMIGSLIVLVSPPHEVNRLGLISKGKAAHPAAKSDNR